MSSINTSKVNVNYPTAGVNNNSQGFRDNFASIKNNLDAAGTEITDLQQKAIVKSALTGMTVDNNMSDTLISNALTRSFRSSTYNLGNALIGTVAIDVSKGDVQYGTISGNVTLGFTGWATAGMQSNVELQLAISNTAAVVTFPPQINVTSCLGASTLESYADIDGAVTVTVPAGVCQLDYRLSSMDNGSSIAIEQFNRPRKSTELRLRSPVPTGFPGDIAGTVCADPTNGLPVIVTATTTGTNLLTTTDTTSLYLDQQVTFSGMAFGSVVPGTTYFIHSIVSPTQFILSQSPGTVSGPSSPFALTTDTGSMLLTPTAFVYVATNSFDSTVNTIRATATDVTGNITLVSTAGIAVNDPIIFSDVEANNVGNVVFGNVVANVGYYVASVNTPNIKISATRYNGITGQPVLLAADTGNMVATWYTAGTSIWKRLPLQSW
jgi:hypothetical protein